MEADTYMFSNAQEFNQPINSWGLSNLIDVKFMFNNTIKFNQSLDSWNFNGAVKQKTFDKSGISFSSLPEDQKSKYKMILVEI